MKIKLLAILLILFTSCSKDNQTEDLITIEYIIENGNADGKITINVPGSRNTTQVGTGASFKETRKVSKDEWYYLSYTTTQKVPDNFKIYVVFDGKKDENVIKGSANWGYTFTLSR